MEACTSAEHQLFQSSYVFEKAIFSEKKNFTPPTFPGELTV